jgi:hypothetical protein
MIVGGVALAALTFVTWFEGPAGGLNAWDGLRRSDVVVFAAGIAAAAAGGWLMFGDVGPELRAVALIGAAAAAIGALVVIVRMVSPPGDVDLEIGIFLALAAAALAVIGGLMALLAATRSPPSV